MRVRHLQESMQQTITLGKNSCGYKPRRYCESEDLTDNNRDTEYIQCWYAFRSYIELLAYSKPYDKEGE